MDSSWSWCGYKTPQLSVFLVASSRGEPGTFKGVEQRQKGNECGEEGMAHES